MRKILMGLIVSTVLSWGTTAKAEMLGSELGVFYTYADFNDFGVGNGLGAKLMFNFLEFFSVEGRASYVKFNDPDTILNDVTIEAIPLEAAAMLILPLDHFRPYVGVGAGYYILTTSRLDLSDEIGFFPMIGLQFNLGDDIGLYAEASWLYLESEIEASTDEADASGLGVNIGISLRF